MIGLDTNILLRFLLADDPVQSPRARKLISTELTEAEPGFVNIVTLAEVFWVLNRAYRLDAAVVAAHLKALMSSPVIVVQSEREVLGALALVEERQEDFADALILALNSSAGCSYTVTFDRRAARRAGMTLLA